jgi:hypothetical protein
LTPRRFRATKEDHLAVAIVFRHDVDVTMQMLAAPVTPSATIQ